jgi:NADPH2:quinone reductase
MKAIIISAPGGPEVLQIAERPKPVIAAGEVLVKVAAAGVNRPDVYQRQGNYPPPKDAPVDIPGLEIAGTIVETGADVTRWKTGDQVCALVIGGGYAEFCAVPAGQCLPIPKGLSMAEAASLPETFFTVWSNVFDRGHLQPGETLLVHGGSGGIGSAAIQIASAMGATVFATAGSDEKCRFCEAIGAQRAINYKTENFADVIKELTAGKGVNVVLDMIGGDYTPLNLLSLAQDGRLVVINTMRGKDVQVDLSLVMRKGLIITGSMLRPRGVEFKAAIAKNLEEKVWPLLASGRIKPVIYKVFPAEQAAQAHRLMETSEHQGKIVLDFINQAS